MNEANGQLTGYNLNCNYMSDEGQAAAVNVNFDSTVFQYEMTDIVATADYECIIAASTSAGRGPNTAPITFTTPGNIEGTRNTIFYSLNIH